MTTTHLDALYRFARFNFECGKYGVAATLLAHVRTLSSDAAQCTQALWGQLASCALMQRWAEALLVLQTLKEHVDAKNTASPAEQLNQRAWLLHWALFVYFNLADGANMLVDLAFQEKYMQAIQSTCPHLWRYVVAAVLLSPRRRALMRDLATQLERNDAVSPFIFTTNTTTTTSTTTTTTAAAAAAAGEQSVTIDAVALDGGRDSDPLVAFVRRLVVALDFDAAHQELERCKAAFAA